MLSPRKILLGGVLVMAAVAALVGTPSVASADPGPSAPAIPEGATLLSSKVAYYTQVSGADSFTVDAPDRDCSFNVNIYRINYGIFGSGTAYCPYNVSRIHNVARLYRSRWFGWEHVGVDDSRTVYNTNYLSVLATYNCLGTGTHDFEAVGQSEILWNGRLYNAYDYDTMVNQSC